jgi:hypothetical protein
MGYSAYVVCNCFQNGITTKPPYQEYFKFDNDGIYLDIPDELWETDEEKVFQMKSEFEEWKDTACEHKEMELCYADLANVLGMHNFRQIIEKLGGKNEYPILSKFLPTSNDGVLPAELSESAFQELLQLEKQKTIEERIVLLENSTNRKIASVNAEEYSIFLFTKFNKHNYGIDKEGFFILENVERNGEEISCVVFRSKKFSQRVISDNNFRFFDYKTGRSFFSTISLYSRNDNPSDYYEFSIIEEKVIIENEYNYIIEPLKRLTKSSFESGNPVHWI